MREYRLYCHNADGGIQRAEIIEARSDDEAIVFARAKKLPFDCEVWDRDRLVAEIPGHLQPAAP